MPQAILRPHQKHAYIIGTFISTGPPAVIIIRIPDENLGGSREFEDYHAQLGCGPPIPWSLRDGENPELVAAKVPVANAPRRYVPAGVGPSISASINARVPSAPVPSPPSSFTVGSVRNRLSGEASHRAATVKERRAMESAN
jgi:hypothetical protein